MNKHAQLIGRSKDGDDMGIGCDGKRSILGKTFLDDSVVDPVSKNIAFPRRQLALKYKQEDPIF
jgi:hypothetical protein